MDTIYKYVNDNHPMTARLITLHELMLQNEAMRLRIELLKLERVTLLNTNSPPCVPHSEGMSEPPINITDTIVSNEAPTVRDHATSEEVPRACENNIGERLSPIDKCVAMQSTMNWIISNQPKRGNVVASAEKESDYYKRYKEVHPSGLTKGLFNRLTQELLNTIIAYRGGAWRWVDVR